eukprot:515614-Pleurochrysis_carterae.AAC.1
MTFPQCALGASSQKYTTLIVSPGLAPALLPLANLLCQHATHPQMAGGSKTASGWTCRLHSAYPPNVNFLFARVIGTFHTARLKLTDAPATKGLPTPPHSPDIHVNAPNRSLAGPQPNLTKHSGSRINANQRDAEQHRTTISAPQQPDAARPAPFKRTLGEYYPLRLRGPAALLTLRARQEKPQWGRGTGCAFTTNNVSTDLRSRKQAMAEDRVDLGTAERAEIANHASNGRWDMGDNPSFGSPVKSICGQADMGLQTQKKRSTEGASLFTRLRPSARRGL